jgi:TolB protein
VYAVSASGAPRPRRLTSVPGQQRDVPVAYSPDGTRILVARTEPDGNDGRPVMLFVMNADGSGLHRVTPPNAGTHFQDNPYLDFAGWSPDGRRIVFVGTAGPGLSEYAVYVVGTDGSGLRRISIPGSTFGAAWSPDGQWIAYDRAGSGPREMYVAHPDGTGTHPVSTASDGQFSFGPAWSPDGKWLLFTRGPGNLSQTDLWLAPVDATAPVQLTDAVGAYTSYAWLA